MPISLWDAGDSGGTGILTGGGGSGPYGHGNTGGGGGLVTDPNAREFGTVLQLLSEGPIAGPINGLKSIKLDGTPILDVAGNPNFKGVALALVAGTNTQVMIPGFTDAEAETSVNVKVSISGGAVTRTIATAGISAIRVRIAIPSLKIINATTGAESGAGVMFKIERQSASYNAGAWETLVLNGEDIIYGKFGAKYTRSVRVETPAAGPWSIRVTRLTPDHVSGAPDYTQDETWWDAYTEITDAKLRYPYSALCALKVDAKQFQQIPKLTMEAKGRIISVPNGYTEASYNSTTGVWTAATYPGIWDGTFVQAWSANPAWIWYDLASHTRYGAGSVLDASKLDKWALYAISQACDVMVSDGKGGTEPRFRCSVYLQSQEDAIKLLQEMASIFRGMAYWAGGLVTAVQDTDASPVAVFTNSNVKDGKFTYQGSARKGRHTAALVTWMDPQNGYQASVEYVEDQTAITRYGYNPTQVAALGATSQAQARRWGSWTLLTETLETEVVSFSSGLEGSTLRPGDIIATRDQFRAGDGRLGGRVLAGATTTAIPLDGPCTLPAGTNTLTVRMQDGTVQTSTITTAAGTVSSITVSPAFTVAPVALSQWAVNVALYRVLGIKKGSDLYWDITALEHTPSKYALIDGVTVTPGPATPVNLLTPPTSLAMADVVRIEKDKLVQTLTSTWSGDATALYVAEASQDYGEWQPMKVNATSASLDGITAGAWRVRVQTIYPAGASAWTTASHTVGTPTQTATDAAAAAAAAAAAQSSANTALADIANIVSDNVLSKGEKSSVIQDWAVLSGEQAGIDAQATAYAVSHAAYDSALSSLSTYLGGLAPAWNDTTQDTTIVGTTFRTNWTNAYTAKTVLLNAIYAAAKALADAAQATANTAITKYNDASNDGIITDLERPGLKTLRATLALAVSAAQTQAGGMGVGHSAIDAAWATFTANVDPVLAATGNSAITKATWDGWWSAVYQEVQNLQGVLATTANNAAAYADTLARSPNNLIKNGNSEDPSATGIEAAGVVSDPGYTYDGTHAVYVMGPSADAGFTKSADIPCIVGDQFLYQCQGRNYGSGTQTGFLIVHWLDASHTILSYTTVAYLPGATYSTAWTPVNGTVTAPAGTCYVRFGVEGMNIVSGGHCGFDSLYACRKISAGMLEADLAILGVIRSPNWVAGAYGSAPVGFWLSGYARTTTYIDGTTSANCFFELQGDANFGGYKVSTVNARIQPVNRIINGYFYTDLNGWSASGANPPTYNSTSATAGTGSAAQYYVGGFGYTKTGTLTQSFSIPQAFPSQTISLAYKTGYYGNGTNFGGDTCTVVVYILNQITGVETLLATHAYSNANAALAWTARSVDITSYVSAGGQFSIRFAMTVNDSHFAGSFTNGVYVDEVTIIA